MKTLYYFGEKYYNESKTMMGVLYTADGERSDWGKVQVALRQGESVIIHPATAIMLEWADARLKEEVE